jgi:hypothetical protein
MRKIAVTFCTLLCATGLSSLSHATSVINIDDFTTFHRIIIFGEASDDSTLASAGSIGGYRTLSLTSYGNVDDVTTLTVSNTYDRMALSTPAGATGTFNVSWAGPLGDGFNSAMDLTLHELLSMHKLKFYLNSADFPSSFTWTFDDIDGNSASYTGNFQAHQGASPTQYMINLSEFANSGVVSWNAINKISFSGGGVKDLDISLVNGITIIPEPTTALLGALGALGLLRRKR